MTRKVGVGRWASCAFRVTLLAILASGCEQPKRPASDLDGVPPEPMAWFDGVTQAAARKDLRAVRASLADQLGGHPPQTQPTKATREVAASLCDDLAFSKPLRSRANPDDRHVVVEVTRLSPGLMGGAAWEYSIDLHYLPRRGWCVASLPYNQRPLGGDRNSEAAGMDALQPGH